MKATMNEAKLYQNSNSLQRRDAVEILEAFSSRIRWSRSEEEKVLDVGCGDGGVTAELLRTHVPGRRATLTGCDVSEEMVRHANLHHKDDRTEFRVLDIAGELPPDMVEEYDHVFSFYTLHWIQNQQKALSNIYETLVAGGDCLLVFLGRVPIYDAYRALAATDKWAACMHDLDNYISPYHDSVEPAQEFARLLRGGGFREVDVQRKRKVFTYDNIDMVKKAVRAVNPFNHRLSAARREEFLEDYAQVLADMGLLQECNNNEGESACVQFEYTLLVAYAVK